MSRESSSTMTPPDPAIDPAYQTVPISQFTPHRPALPQANAFCRRPTRLERLHNGGTLLGAADVERGHPEHGLALQLRRDEWLGRRSQQHARGRQLVRCGVGAACWEALRKVSASRT